MVKIPFCRNRDILWRSNRLATSGKTPHDSPMQTHSGLAKNNIIGFVTIVDVERAKEFYRDKLGLRLLSEEPPFALVFDANGIILRLGMGKELPPARGTVLGWEVPDVAATVRDATGAAAKACVATLRRA